MMQNIRGAKAFRAYEKAESFGNNAIKFIDETALDEPWACSVVAVLKQS